MRKFWYIYGWIFVRPRRWFFQKMMFKGSFGLQLWFKRNEYWSKEFDSYCKKWYWPNIHWWILYKTVFKFFTWVYYDGWRPLCKWKNGWRTSMPWYAKLIQLIGRTTAGWPISGHILECYHCAFEKGSQINCSEDDTGKTFILEDCGVSCTQDGDDHWFRGTTICPICGYKQSYSDGSL